MNEELLIIINYCDENITLFKENINKLSEFFKNIVICNKGNLNLDINYPVFNGINYNYLEKINEHIKLNKLDVKAIVSIDNILEVASDDIAKCGYEAINTKDAIIMGSDDSKCISKDFINKLFNTLFNTNFKTVLPNIKAINIELLNSQLNKITTVNNYLITAINENISLKEEDIKTIWRKNTIKKEKGRHKVIPYLKNLVPYIIKSIIPYLISLVLFMIIFYIKSDVNDLKGIIFANLISEGVGIVLHIIINYQSIYKYNLISRNILFLLKKIFRIILSCFFIYILYNLLNINLLISKLVVDFILMIVIALIFTTK